MNANDIKNNQMHINRLLRQADMERMARMSAGDGDANALRARVLGPLGHRLVQIGAAMVAASEPAKIEYVDVEQINVCVS